MLGGQEEVVKKAYFKNYGAIIPFNKKELHQCIQCAGDFGGDEYGYATGNATLARKLGDFRKVFDQTLLHDYFYAPGPGFSKKNCAPTT